jgi:hypothetical protein
VKSLDIPGKCLLVMRISFLVLLASRRMSRVSHDEILEFFQRFPIDDEAEDLVMKLFSASLHGGPEDGIITFQMPASILWSILKKFFLRNGP